MHDRGQEMSRTGLIVVATLFALNTAFAADANKQLKMLAESREAQLAPNDLNRFEWLLNTDKILAVKHIDRATLNAIGKLLLLSNADEAFQQKQTNDLSDLWSRVSIDVDPEGFAYLVDTIEQVHGRPPVFGGAPKIESNKVVRPPDFVDTDRDRVGLPPVAQFYDVVDRRLAKGADPEEIFKRSLAARKPNYPKNWALRTQLVQLVRKDQSVHEGSIDEKRMHAIDEENHSELTQIIRDHGFPDQATVGRFGVASVWLIVQHQIRDPALMKRFRDWAKDAMDRGELAHVSYALLDDRVRCYIDGELEIYGTQSGGADKDGQFIPVIDRPHLNDRRAAMLMPPLNLKTARGDCKAMQAAFNPTSATTKKP